MPDPRTTLLSCLLLAGFGAGPGASAADERELGTIAFPSLAPRGWDLYLHEDAGERLLVGGDALEFNASFSPDGEAVAYVGSDHGNLDIYIYSLRDKTTRRLTHHRAMDDHPTWSPAGTRLAFASTRQANEPGRAWTGIYSIPSDGGEPRRLSPDGTSDYSPAWSPAGDRIAFASGAGSPGGTDLYLMKPDGSERRKLADNGGWPTFIEAGQAVAFHRRGEDNVWGIWRIGIDGTNPAILVREASMPAATFDGTRLAYVSHQTDGRQIQVLEVASGKRGPLISSSTDLWNPTVSPDGRTLIYHRATPGKRGWNVELWETPPELPVHLLRVAGGFPAFSPDNERVAVTTSSFSKLDVMNPDGSDRHTVFEGRTRTLFGLSWLPHPSRLAFSQGIAFGPPNAEVTLSSLDPENPGATSQVLIERPGNSAFPSASPDGRQIVFRAESDGFKNLFVLNRDSGGTRQLTRGAWTDTMPHWSPTGEWIAFSSTRDNDFEIWMTRPDGSGLFKLIGDGGRNTHPQFSPDGQWIVFASQRAGYSAELVSLPGMPQPYGDLFAIRSDGTHLMRLTHNAFEEGTPAWVDLRSVRPSQTPFTGRGEF